MPATTSRSLLLVGLLAALLLVPFLGARSIQNPDEPREAEIAREAAVGDWSVVPELNGEPFLEHPPLFYWMSAAGMRAAGEPTDTSARLASVLLGALMAVSVWIAADALLGAGTNRPAETGSAAGTTAALLALASPYLFLRFRQCLSDTGLIAFTALSLALFFRGYVRNSRRDTALAGGAAALAFLCKGLVGLGIPAVAALAFLVFRRDVRAILRLRLWVAVLVGLGVCAPWVIALHAAEGEGGLYRFFIWNHFGRFGAGADHAKPFWYYARIVVAALPLTPLAIAAALHRPQGEDPQAAARRAARLAGLCWVLAPLLALSAASGKRTIYLAPLFPGIALLAACALTAADAGTLRPRLLAFVRGTVAVLRAVTLTFRLRRGEGLARGIAPACVVLAALATAADAFVLSRRNATASGYAVAAHADALAAGRPLVLYGAGEGDVGQFAFALRRKPTVAWNARRLAAACGDRAAVVLGARDVMESAGRGRRDDKGPPQLRMLGTGIANEDEYGIYEWPPRDGK